MSTEDRLIGYPGAGTRGVKRCKFPKVGAGKSNNGCIVPELSLQHRGGILEYAENSGLPQKALYFLRGME